MGEVLVTGSLFFRVGFLPHSVRWKAFAQLKQHGYILKHAVFPGFSSSGLKARRTAKLCFPLNSTAISDYFFYCFYFLMTIKSWLWVGGCGQAALSCYLWKWKACDENEKKEVYCSDETGWTLHNGLDYIPAQSLHFVLASSSNMLKG